MPRLTVVVGCILVLLGLGGYLATGATSPTALIPAAAGLLFIGAGLLARLENLRKHAMHAAAVIALLGLAGTVGGLVKSFALATGGTVERPAAVLAQAGMAVLCGSYLALAVRSFIQARILRKP